MSYATCEAALKAKILLLTSTFLAGDVTQSDERTLDSGLDATHGPNKVILWPGQVKSDTVSNDGLAVRTWGIYTDLFTVYQDDSDWADFKTTRDALMRNLETDQIIIQISGSVAWIDGIASEGNPDMVLDKQGSGPFFITQRIRVNVTEKAS